MSQRANKESSSLAKEKLRKTGPTDGPAWDLPVSILKGEAIMQNH